MNNFVLLLYFKRKMKVVDLGESQPRNLILQSTMLLRQSLTACCPIVATFCTLTRPDKNTKNVTCRLAVVEVLYRRGLSTRFSLVGPTKVKAR